jgi:hypothetical protein
MRYSKTLLLILSILLIVLPSYLNAQIRVEKVEAGFDAGSKDGIIYALPRTIIRVDVSVVQKELLAGPLRNYAEQFLGITDYIERDGIEYTLGSVVLRAVSEPDPDQFYFVTQTEKTSKAAWQTIMKLNGQGMITYAGAGSGSSAVNTDGLIRSLSEDEVRDLFSMYADLNLYARIDTVIRTINIDTITIEDYTFKTTMTNKPLEVKARETADMIHRIREGRYNLLTGYQEVNYSEGAMRFMNQELLKLEEDYLRLFTGAVVESELTYSFSFLPTMENSGSNVPIFNMSSSNGIAEGSGNGIQGYIRVDSHGNTSAFAQGEANDGGGLVYRIPEKAVVQLVYNGNTITQIFAGISQFGRVASLPADVSNVEFDGETGGLRSIRLEAE